MPKRKTEPASDAPKIRPALSPEAEENQCIALAYNLVKQRLLDGTATSQETTHFLRMGSTRGKKEQEIMDLQKELIKAKTDNLKAEEVRTQMFTDAIKAMKQYQGAFEDGD